MERRARRPEPAREEPGLFDEPVATPSLPAPELAVPVPEPVRPGPARPEPTRSEPAPPPLYTVAQLSGRIHSSLQELGRVRVEGEIGRASCRERVYTSV